MLLSFSEIIHFTIHKFVETLFKFTMIQQLEIDVSSITPQKGIIESWSLDRLHLAPLSGQTPSFLGSSDGWSNLLPLKKGISWWILSSPPGDTDWVGHKNDDESGQHLPQLPSGKVVRVTRWWTLGSLNFWQWQLTELNLNRTSVNSCGVGSTAVGLQCCQQRWFLCTYLNLKKYKVLTLKIFSTHCACIEVFEVDVRNRKVASANFKKGRFPETLVVFNPQKCHSRWHTLPLVKPSQSGDPNKDNNESN